MICGAAQGGHTDGASLLIFPDGTSVTSKCVAHLKPVPPGTEGMFLFAVCAVPWV